MSFGSSPRPPAPMALPTEVKLSASAEAEAARRDLIERMKRVAMNRTKSQLAKPALMPATMRPVLSEKLG